MARLEHCWLLLNTVDMGTLLAPVEHCNAVVNGSGFAYQQLRMERSCVAVAGARPNKILPAETYHHSPPLEGNNLLKKNPLISLPLWRKNTNLQSVPMSNIETPLKQSISIWFLLHMHVSSC